MTPPAHKTKIVATIGPASDALGVLEQLIRAGMNVARLNFSHGDFAYHQRVIHSIRAVAQSIGQPVAVMADLPGPKIRIGKLVAENLELSAGEKFTLTTDDIIGNHQRAAVSFGRLPQVVKPGDRLSLNDGRIQLEVLGVSGADIDCLIKSGGPLGSRKGLNLPGIALGGSAFTPRDRECLRFALEAGVDAISQSFVESAADLQAVRQAARELGHEPFLVAKIERSLAVVRLDEILQAADGVMIARGDLGIELPLERIAIVQKEIVRRANQRAKPVIIATQMLESMTLNRLPTRAEATDVSNAILDGTDCLMLSAETATGAFPVEAVATLARIAATVETTRPRLTVKDMYAGVDLRAKVQPMHLVLVGVEASLGYLKPAAVVTSTDEGALARRLSTFHLPVWTLALTPSAKTAQDLLFSSSVLALRQTRAATSWNRCVRDCVRQHGLDGAFAIFVGGPTSNDPDGNHRLEIVDL